MPGAPFVPRGWFRSSRVDYYALRERFQRKDYADASAVWLVLTDFENAQRNGGTEFEAGQELISQMTGLSRSRVCALLSAFERFGLLVVRRRGRPFLNAYRIDHPSAHGPDAAARAPKAAQQPDAPLAEGLERAFAVLRDSGRFTSLQPAALAVVAGEFPELDMAEHAAALVAIAESDSRAVVGSPVQFLRKHLREIGAGRSTRRQSDKYSGGRPVPGQKQGSFPEQRKPQRWQPDMRT